MNSIYEYSRFSCKIEFSFHYHISRYATYSYLSFFLRVSRYSDDSLISSWWDFYHASILDTILKLPFRATVEFPFHNCILRNYIFLPSDNGANARRSQLRASADFSDNTKFISRRTIVSDEGHFIFHQLHSLTASWLSDSEIESQNILYISTWTLLISWLSMLDEQPPFISPSC